MKFFAAFAAFAALSPAFAPGQPFFLSGIPTNAVLKTSAGVECQRFLTRARCVANSAAQHLAFTVDHGGVSERATLNSGLQFHFDFPQLVYSAEAAAGRRCDAGTDAQFAALVQQQIGLKSSQQKIKAARVLGIREEEINALYPGLQKVIFGLIAVVYELSCRGGLETLENGSLAVANVPVKPLRRLGIELSEPELQAAVLDIMGSYGALRWGVRTGEDSLNAHFSPKGIDLQRVFDDPGVRQLTAGIAEGRSSTALWFIPAGLIGLVFAVLIVLILHAGRRARAQAQEPSAHDC